MYKYSYSVEIFKRTNGPIVIHFLPSNDTYLLGENKLPKKDFLLFSFRCILSITMSKLLDGFAIKTDPCDFLPSKLSM